MFSSLTQASAQKKARSVASALTCSSMMHHRHMQPFAARLE